MTGIVMFSWFFSVIALLNLSTSFWWLSGEQLGVIDDSFSHCWVLLISYPWRAYIKFYYERFFVFFRTVTARGKDQKHKCICKKVICRFPDLCSGTFFFWGKKYSASSRKKKAVGVISYGPGGLSWDVCQCKWALRKISAPKDFRFRAMTAKLYFRLCVGGGEQNNFRGAGTCQWVQSDEQYCCMVPYNTYLKGSARCKLGTSMHCPVYERIPGPAMPPQLQTRYVSCWAVFTMPSHQLCEIRVQQRVVHFCWTKWRCRNKVKWSAAWDF